MRSARPQNGKLEPEDLARPQLERGAAYALAAGFVLLLAGVPIHQALTELRQDGQVRALQLLRETPQLSDFALDDRGNPLRAFEQSLVEASIPRRAARPRLQALLTGALGAGNASVVLGRGGWLFYRPGIDYVSGPGFLSERAALSGARSRADVGPLAAISRFQADCRAAGVRLVLMPVPEKNQLCFEHLTGSPSSALPRSADYLELLARLRTMGVEVFDPTPVLAQAAHENRAFLRQETHWTPQAMDAVAAALAHHLRGSVSLAASRSGWTTARKPITRLGDLVYNLQLPPDQALFAPETAIIEPVQTPAGAPFESDRDAEVLLLGDSFSNVYAQADMGWGEHAGLAAHLALHLGSPVDAIAVNAGGASESRRQLAARADPLAGKKVVVWEFVARDLSERNWEEIPMRGKPRPAAASRGPLVVLAKLLTRPSLPPASTLYANARVFLKYEVKRVLSGRYGGAAVLVQVPVLRDRQPLPSLHYRVGALQELTLAEKVPDEWEGQPVVDDTGEYDLAPLWGAAVRPAD